MKFTLIAFHFIRMDLLPDGKLYGLKSLVDELEREAAVVGQGIYILCSLSHEELVGRTQRFLRQTDTHFAVVSFRCDRGHVLEHTPLATDLPDMAREKLAKWLAVDASHQ